MHTPNISAVDFLKYGYEQAQLICKDIIFDTESTSYSGCDLRIEDYLVKFRCARITPKKAGQFVTLWKRNALGVSTPYDTSDQVDFFVISVFTHEQSGQFIFPKKVLCENNVVSGNGMQGKRAMRLYPPWEKKLNLQAKKSQEWQLRYFVFTPELLTEIHVKRIRALYNFL